MDEVHLGTDQPTDEVGDLGELMYGSCKFEDAEDLAEVTGIPVRFIEKRIKEGKTGDELVTQYQERQAFLETVKYLGLHDM